VNIKIQELRAVAKKATVNSAHTKMDDCTIILQMPQAKTRVGWGNTTQ